MEQVRATREIRRYDNRKLYEPATRRYVTVAEIGAAVAQGDEVEVRDQKTGEDLTSQILAQVLLDRLRGRAASIPRQVLVTLVRLAAGTGAALDWPEPQHAAQRVRSEAERIATGLLARGRLSIDEALGLRQEIAHAMQSALADTQHALEGRVRGLFAHAGQGHAVQPALKALGKQLETLESDLARPRSTRRVRRG